MIAASTSPPVAYLKEPFNLLHRPGICDARFPYWFPYLCEENGSAYRAPITDMLRFRYKTAAELRAVRTPKDAARLIRDRARFGRYRRQHAVPLQKDPIAVFSAGWLCDTFGMDVVVLIRHPCGFANSLARLGWDHPFDHFLRQPLLMRDVLQPFEAEVRDFAARPRPPLEQGILLWNLIHHAILRYRRERSDWLFLRLEDVAREPAAVFRDIYSRLGLAFTDEVAAVIAAHTEPSNPATAVRPDDVRRNSRASAVAWKQALTAEEIRRIRIGVERIAAEFYSDEDW